MAVSTHMPVPAAIDQGVVAPRKRRFGRYFLLGFIVILLSLLVYMGVLGGNVRTVVAGKIYRSSQLTGNSLQARVANWTGAGLQNVILVDNIKTVICLRGGSMKDDWYRKETSICTADHVKHIPSQT